VQAKGRRPNGLWGRLAWTLPVALLLTTLGLAGFLDVLIRGLSPPPPTSNAVALRIVELPPEPRPPTPETAPPAPVRPMPPRKPIPENEQPPPTPVQPSPLPPKPTPAIKTPPSTPVQPLPPEPAPTTEPLPLLPPPPPPPTTAPRRETTAVQPRKSSPANPAPLHRDRVRSLPQHPTGSSTGAAPVAPPTRSSTGGITMGARALYRPMPDIPEELRHRQLAVVAMARFHVAVDGSATVTLLQATADPGLNATLMSALQKWRFFPAMDNGRPIASTIDIRIPVEVR
jgi:periplasmic protein TonB